MTRSLALTGAVALVGLAGLVSGPVRDLLVRLEPLVAPGLFLAALVIAVRGRLRGRSRLERRLARALSGPAGFALAALAFVMPVWAAWALQPTGAAGATAALFGRIPHLDTHGHLEGAMKLLVDGQLTDFSARRPLNACWLAVRLAVFGSLPAALLAQAVLLGVAVAAACRAAAARWGIAPALAAFALLLGLLRDYAATTATEPLGATLAALGIAVLLGRNGTTALPRLAVGLALVDMALHARPGAQFLTVALGLAAVVSLPGRRRAAAAIVAAVIVANAGLTGALNRLYGAGDASFSSYPAYTVYGLAVGDNYKRAVEDHGPVLESLPSERERSRFLYQQSWDTFRRQPAVLVLTLGDNALEFLSKLVPNLGRVTSPVVLLARPQEQVRPSRMVVESYLALGLPVLLACAAGAAFRSRRMGRRWQLFWLLGFAGVVGSAGVIYGDAGFRGLAAAYPFLALLLGQGLAARRAGGEPLEGWSRNLCRAAVAGAVVLALAALAGPAAARAARTRPEPAVLASMDPAREHVLRIDALSPAIVVWNQPPPDLAPLALSRREFQTHLALGEARHAPQLEQLKPPLAIVSAWDFVGRRQRVFVADPFILRDRGEFLHVYGEPLGELVRVSRHERLAAVD